MQTPDIKKRLKAALPTIVAGPSYPGSVSNVEIVSIVARRISGALEPNAINVKLATVAFHTITLKSLLFPFSSVIFRVLVYAVITSIALMKISETIEIPRKR